MVLRLRVRVCCRGGCVESVGIANTGFAGREPEIAMGEYIAKTLFGNNISVNYVERVLANGTRALLPRTTEQLDLYVVTEDRVEGPVKVYAYITKAKTMLINDHALSLLRIVIIDPKEGLWCFRDEIGRRERRGI